MTARNLLSQIRYSKKFYHMASALLRCCPGVAARIVKRKECKAIRDEAVRCFAQGVEMPDGASRDDYFKAWKNNQVSLSEYLYQFEFYGKSDAERSQFISRAQTRALSMKLRMMFPECDKIDLLRDKEKFLAHFAPLGFCNRRWLYTPAATFDQFAALVGSADCIFKPHDASLGFGIRRVPRQQGPQLRQMFDDCVKQQTLVEEYIVGDDAIQQFHPSSLNSIRFVTVAYGGKAFPFGAFLRMGVGDMLIDNAHAGGLFAQINMESGIIESDGITVDGLRVPVHPDSKLPIKGFQIPQWPAIVDFCLDAARQTNNIITGWDVIITQQGKLEFIEANSRPDFDVMQSPLKIGVKHKLLDMLSEVTGKKVTI